MISSKKKRELEIAQKFYRLVLDYRIYKIYNKEIVSMIESEYDLLRRTGKLHIIYDLIVLPGYSENFIETHFIDLFSKRWDIITMYQNLSEEFIDKHKDDISWQCVCLYQSLNTNFIKSHSEYIWWECLEYNPKIKQRLNYDSELFSLVNIESRINTVISLYCPGEKKINTTTVMFNILGSPEMEDIIYRYKDLLSWSEIFKFPISEGLIIRCKEFFNWRPEIIDYMIEYQDLRPDFIDTEILGKYGSTNRVWHLICRYQNLPQYFMITHDKNLDWAYIKKYQKYDEDFEFLYKKELENV